MVLQVEPNPVEAHQAGEFENRWITEMHRRDEHRLILGELGFNAAGQHGRSFSGVEVCRSYVKFDRLEW